MKIHSSFPLIGKCISAHELYSYNLILFIIAPMSTENFKIIEKS